MKSIVLLICTLIISLFFQSCSTTQKIELMKPEPNEAAPLTYPITSSYISFPISLAVKDIQSQTNKSLNGLIYEDKILEDDNIQTNVWKNGDIQILEENGKLKSVIPLKIWVKYRYGTSALGMNLYDTKEFNLNGVITLLSEINLSNWKITTLTSLEKIDWNESPTMTIAGKELKITYLINPALKLFESKIEKMIDESMAKAMDFKSNILDVMQKISDPVEMSPTYQTWLKITPQELYATNTKLEKGSVNLNVGLKCLMESYIGHKPTVKFDKEKIALKSVTSIPDKVIANISAVSLYKDASRIMTNNFKGQEFGNGKRKVTVQNVEIWHKSGKMIIALDMTGSLNGRIYLSGLPKYDTTKKEIYFDDLDYALETKSKLMKTANWLFQGMVLNKMKGSCRYSIQSNLDEGKKTILNYLNNYSPMKGVFINGKINDIVFDKIHLTNYAIVAFLNITGNVKVNVNGME